MCTESKYFITSSKLTFNFVPLCWGLFDMARSHFHAAILFFLWRICILCYGSTYIVLIKMLTNRCCTIACVELTGYHDHLTVLGYLGSRSIISSKQETLLEKRSPEWYRKCKSIKEKVNLFHEEVHDLQLFLRQCFELFMSVCLHFKEPLTSGIGILPWEVCKKKKRLCHPSLTVDTIYSVSTMQHKP